MGHLEKIEFDVNVCAAACQTCNVNRAKTHRGAQSTKHAGRQTPVSFPACWTAPRAETDKVYVL